MIIEEITTEQESEFELTSINCRRGQRRYAVLGFFVTFDNMAREPPVFVSTSTTGKKLAEGEWGNLNESLNFFAGGQFDILGSSNGFLLCRSNNPKPTMELQYRDHYIICNPVTGQFRYIPNPRKACLVAPPILVAEGTNVASLDEFHHQVVIARVGRKGFDLETETFCSSGNKWNQASLSVDFPFPWNLENAPPFAVDGVIYWTATFHRLSGYDTALVGYGYTAKPPPRARVVAAPPRRGGGHDHYRADFFGPSEGKVHCARRDSDHFEIWVFEDCWIMKHRVSLMFPGFVGAWLGIDRRNAKSGPEVISFQPEDSGMIFMTLGMRTFCYDIRSRRMRGNVHSFGDSVNLFFLYEWPQLSNLDDSY